MNLLREAPYSVTTLTVNPPITQGVHGMACDARLLCVTVTLAGHVGPRDPPEAL